MDSSLSKLRLNNLHPRPSDVRFEYGTAGFRSRADLLDHVMFRMGMLAVLRGRLLGGCMGVMVTASHNPEEDNGVKLVDPTGEMMDEAWEEVATRLANALDEELQVIIDDIIKKHQIHTHSSFPVAVAMDTRPSSKTLLTCVQEGVNEMGSHCLDYGELTTPQLHYMVRCIHSKKVASRPHHLDDKDGGDDDGGDDDGGDEDGGDDDGGEECYGEETEEGYVGKLTKAFLQLNTREDNRVKSKLFVDGANGVGAKKLASIQGRVDNIVEMKVFNDGTKGKLNYMCGADYVKSNQKAPSGMLKEAGQLCCSFDGDADRIVFYYHDNHDQFHLLDGDKIAVLLCTHLAQLVEQTGLSKSLGVVQTAYANGSSTQYITNHIGIPVTCTATGVKNLHKAAKQYDIGVYFEANGHGTVTYKPSVRLQLHHLSKTTQDKEIQQACERFISFINLTNQTVGDAISDLLLVQTVLWGRGWSAQEWMNMYNDLPNKLLKIKVKDRRVLQTEDAERKVTKPTSLQPIINQLVLKYCSARSFVRPSGTEDVVRIYAEASSQEEVERLAWEVSCAVYKEAGGVGGIPEMTS